MVENKFPMWPEEKATTGCEGPPRVLLADDAAASRILTSAMLRRMGLLVDAAENGEQVVKLIQCYSYQLMLLDIDMPVLDGLTAAREVRLLEGLARRTPIIAVSGFLYGATNRDCRDVFDAAVPKPVNFARLRQTMIELIPTLRSFVAYYNAPQPTQKQCPLVNVAGAGREPNELIDRIRKTVGTLNGALRDNDQALIMQVVEELSRFSTQMVVPRIQRSAATILNSEGKKSETELHEQVTALLSCAAATIAELRKVSKELSEPGSSTGSLGANDWTLESTFESGRCHLKLVS